jgi:hypothetical protein
MENKRDYLINWLNEHGEKALSLIETYDIRVGRDSRWPNLFNLKYGTIMADKSLPLVCACRGAVVELMPSGKFELRAYAFDRFFNVGETYAAEIDWSTARVAEKYDGSLIKLFNYKGEWIVSTSGSVGGASEVGTTGRSFEELFWATFNEVGYERADLRKEFVYIFELCHRDNRIVVDYETPILPLLAVRDSTQNFKELDTKYFKNYFMVAQTFDLRSQEAVTQFVNDASRGTAEGVIIVDANGNRQKDKSNVYCQLHRVKGNGEPSFSELFLNDDLDEFLLHFPEYTEGFNAHRANLKVWEELANRVCTEFEYVDQKTFAKKVFEIAPAVSGACFSIRSGKFDNFGQWLGSLTAKKLDALLGLK